MKLRVLQSPDNQSREMVLNAGQNVAGRDPGNALHLPSRRVSRKHCSFSVENNRVVVRDLGSSNGVVVEGQRVREAELQNGQRIQIGDYLLQFIQDTPKQDFPVAPTPSDNEPSPFGGDSSFGGDSPFGGDSSFGEEPSSGFGGGQAFNDNAFGSPNEPAPPESPPPFSTPPPGETPAPPKTEDEPNNPFGALPDTPNAGFGDHSLSGGFGTNSGFGAVPEANHPGPASNNLSQEEGKKDALGKLKASLYRIPWAQKLGALLVGALLLVMLAPGGGILSLLSRAESTMEQMSIEHAKQIVRVSARENALLIPEEGGRYSLRRANVSALQQISGVTPLGPLVVDLTGNIKAPAEKVGTEQPAGVARLIQSAVGSQTLAHQWSGPLLQIFAPIRFDAGGPAQVVGGIYLEYEPSEFVSDIGRPTSLALIAFVVIGLIFTLIFFTTWHMTNQPVAAIREELELAIMGHQPQIQFETHWPELEQLVHSINRILRRAGPGDSNTDAQQLASLVALSSWPVIVTDGSLRVTAANPVAGRILGGDVAKALGKPLSRLVSDPQLGQEMKTLLSQLGGAKGKHGSVSVVMDGHPRKLSIAIETSVATGELAYAVVVIA